MVASSLNLFDPATLAAGHPHAEYDRLRSIAPAWRHPASPVQPPFLALLSHQLIEAVSRDSAHFTSTREFRLATDRRVVIPEHVTRLLSFGIGAHHCAGARMALMQLQHLLGELLARFPHYQITAEPDFLAGNLVWGVKSLKVRLGRRAH